MKRKTQKIILACAMAVTLTVMGALLSGCESEETPPSSNDPATSEGTADTAGVNVTYYLSQTDPTPITVRVTDGILSLPSLPTMEHYRFNGLFDAPTGGAMYVDQYGKCLVAIEKPVILHAQWVGNPHYITFDAQGATLPVGSKELSINYGDTLLTFPVAEKDGHTFLGWADTNGTMYSDGANVLRAKQTFTKEAYPIETDSVTLVPVFEVSKLKVVFDYNDGSYETQELLVEYGQTIPENAFPTKDTGEREIAGWSTIPSGTDSFNGAVKESITLYAVWKDYRIFTLHDGQNQTQIRVYRNEAFDLTTYNGIAKPGYRAAGWYATAHYSGNPFTEITYGSATKVYYAKWEATSYTLTFDTNTAGVNLPSITYHIGDTTALPIPTVLGCTFEGWCTKSDLSDTPMTAIPATLYGDLILYAKITPNSYTISLQGEGGTLYETQVTVRFRDRYQLPVPTQTGHTFLGWYNGTESSAVAYTDATGAALTEYALGTDVTLYAHWSSITFTVTFETNGGSAINPVTYNYNEKLTYPPDPIKSGVFFDGWYNADLTQNYLESFRVTSDLTLYAKWLESTPISTAEELKAITNDPTKNYHLTADINLNGDAWTTLPTFSGTLNGKGYKIFNFTIGGTETNVGFVGINQGTIQNLTFADFTYVATHSSPDNEFGGLIVAQNESGSIKNCHVLDGVIKFAKSFTNYGSDYFCGGIAGANGEGGVIDSCTVKAELQYILITQNSWYSDFVIKMYAGGIAGENLGIISNCSTTLNATHYISADSAYTNKNSSYLYSGGLVGRNDEVGFLKNSECFVTFTATADASTTSGSAEPRLGGAVGYNYGKIDSCSAVGTITAGDHFDWTRLGGFACHNLDKGSITNCYAAVDMTMTSGGIKYSTLGGFVSDNTSVIANCYASGNVTSTVPLKGIGGFVGETSDTGNISRCFSTGNVTSPEANGSGYFLGYAANLNINYKCFYNADMTVTIGGAVGTPATTAGSTAITATQLMSADMIFNTLAWDTATWHARQGEFPILRWQLQ